tara:strand:- start:314 stop:574 length:261 start_codon:yes stop_codon:yes gene_type:complete
MFTNLLAATGPVTFHWSPKVAVVMIICNVLACAIAKANIAQPNVGFTMPNARYYAGMSHASVVAALCLGHVLGIGSILGLASRGVL